MAILFFQNMPDSARIHSYTRYSKAKHTLKIYNSSYNIEDARGLTVKSLHTAAVGGGIIESKPSIHRLIRGNNDGSSNFTESIIFVSDNRMLLALLNIEPDKVFAMPDPNLPDDDYKMMATLSDLADRELVATIGWAKQVPGLFLTSLVIFKWTLTLQT